MLSAHYVFLSIMIAVIQALFNAAIMLLAWRDWRTYKRVSSILLFTAGLVAFLAYALSLVPVVSRLSSIGIAFLLIPVWTWSWWTIYNEKKLLWYSFLFCFLFVV